MKICFIIPRAYEYFFKVENAMGGGAEKQVFLLSKGLSTYEDLDIHLCLADFGQEQYLKSNNISFWRIHKLEDNKFLGLRKIIKTLRKIDADLYIFISAHPAILVLTAYIKTYLKKKVIYLMASDVETQYNTLRKHSGLITALFMQTTYKIVDLLIVQNKYQLVKKKKRKYKPTILIPNPIQISSEIINVDFKSKSGAIWVGRLAPIKQTELYLKLANMFPTVPFAMIAPNPPEHAQYGDNIITQLATCKNINYIKYVPNNEILEYYKNARIYIMTSLREGFSNTMMEAMLAGCAVLSLNVNPNGLFDSQENGLCANGDFDLFTRYFERLMTDSEFAKKLGQNAQNYIISNHEQTKVVEQMATNLKKLGSI